MQSEFKCLLKDHADFKINALKWASTFTTACYFDSNNFPDPYSAFDVLIAAGSANEVLADTEIAFEKLQAFLDENKSWAIGYLGYDLKNELESLTSSNIDNLKFPALYFFIPEHLILIKGEEIQILSNSPEQIVRDIDSQPKTESIKSSPVKIKSRFSRQEYVDTVKKLQKHISLGDIYEINFCQEFYCEDAGINPLETFRDLNHASPTPFATFFKLDGRYIISATPERFLSKRGNKLISQPIKGTAPRGNSPTEDKTLKERLGADEKERAENVMIVDLVRNDLTKCALPGTVRVEELFGIYSFEQVHQMISTVVCSVADNHRLTDMVKAAFPMGSMTGAPKVSAMKLIENYEKTKRGVFSGAVGYFSPSGDFDFNVVIRSLLYCAETKYLSFQVGSAITYGSIPEDEYQECILKAEAILKVLS